MQLLKGQGLRLLQCPIILLPITSFIIVLDELSSVMFQASSLHLWTYKNFKLFVALPSPTTVVKMYSDFKNISE